MLDQRPLDYKDPEQWFRYFRFTKHLPAIKEKFAKEIRLASNGQEMQMVTHAYVATALDILTVHYTTPSAFLCRELKEIFNLMPEDLLALSIPDLAKTACSGEARFRASLSGAGYTIENDIITAFTPPKPAKPALSQPKP